MNAQSTNQPNLEQQFITSVKLVRNYLQVNNLTLRDIQYTRKCLKFVFPYLQDEVFDYYFSLAINDV